MPLSQGQIAKAQKWMELKDVDRQCESCGRNKWAPGGVIFPPGESSTDSDDDSAFVPMVQMICQSCGYIRLYSATLMGITRNSD